GGDRPEALAVRCVYRRLMPVHRRFAAVHLEQMVREAVGEVVEVGEIKWQARHASPQSTQSSPRRCNQASAPWCSWCPGGPSQRFQNFTRFGLNSTRLDVDVLRQ